MTKLELKLSLLDLLLNRLAATSGRKAEATRLLARIETLRAELEAELEAAISAP